MPRKNTHTGQQYGPTPQQQDAMDLFSTGENLVIEAGAGTGKTTTLAMLARTTGRAGAYLAFNKAIAQDAGRAMPMTVHSRTVHSVAMQAIRNDPRRRAILDRLGGARMSPAKMARHLGLGPLVVSVPTPAGPPRQKVLQPAWQASHVMRAAAVFCQSADLEPSRKHFPYVEGIDPPDSNGKRGWINNRQVARELESYLLKAWDDLTAPQGQLRFSHDVYLKLWHLGRYQIQADFLLFDEAQDASPVMLAALANQDTRQVVYVGDSCQQIYEWRGAINALALVDETTPRAFLTRSWRFGPAIAGVANAALDQLDAELRLTGTDSIPSVVHTTDTAPSPRAVLCRSNGMAVNAVLQFQAQGMVPHLVGGSEEIVRFAKAAAQLQAGERTGHPELSCFDTWPEVLEYVADDPQGDELRMMVSIIDKYGVDVVIEALDGLLTEQQADVIISTAHKAKGREWEAVRLAPDFEPQGDDRSLSDPEWRLLYVAATRATHHLDISSCRPLRDLMVADSNEPVTLGE